MRGKRVAALLLAALMALGLAGCGAGKDKEDKQDSGAMTIRPAQLSGEEEKLVELLAVGMESYRIFDFRVEGAKYLQLDLYELVDGSWSRLPGGGGVGLSAEEGRIALGFGKVTDGVRMAIQADGATYSCSAQVEPGDDVSGMAFGTSKLDDASSIELEQEIPLVLQVASSSGELSMYKVDYFGMPRELAKHGYEHVYAITVTFSAQEFGGASGPAPVEPSAEPSPEE